MRAIFLGVILIVALVACNNATETDKKEAGQMQQNEQASQSKPDFSNVQFASKIDTTCGMPITAGVTDTLVLDGKVYGFCAKECKDDFVKTLAAKK